MIKLLALDCSTEACSVALYTRCPNSPVGAGEIIIEHSALAAREHTQQLLPMVERVLAEAGFGLSEMDACAYGRGPGSFTGLRVALGAIQGLAFGADLPVVAVSTLAGLAQTWLDATPVRAGADTILAAIDARMGELYWAAYGIEQGLVVARLNERLSAPEEISVDLIESNSGIIAIGSGWNYLPEMRLQGLQLSLEPHWLPAAGAIARLADDLFNKGQQVSAQQALPTYLREQVAWQKS